MTQLGGVGYLVVDQVERHVLYLSPLKGRFYFASKVQVLSETARRVVGSKYDVTAYIEPYLLKKYRSRSPGQPT